MDIDGVSAVLGAIAASAAAGGGDAVKDTTKAAIAGARDRLISLVRERMKSNHDADAQLTQYATEPTPVNAQALKRHLDDAGIGQDREVTMLAHEVLHALGPAAVAPGSVAATVITQTNTKGGIGFVGGHHVHHHNPGRTTA